MREYWPIPRLWDGDTCVILAGGPSLNLAQVRRVAMAHQEGRCRAIAINDSVFVAWWADWLHACDYKWWNWHRLSATKFPGVRTALVEQVPPAWAHLLRNAAGSGGQAGGWDDDPATIYPGGNSGYQAIQIAAKAGARKIVLLGYDMKPAADGAAHWFGDHPDNIRSSYADRMVPWFETLVEPLRERGVEVINCTPGTALHCFPKSRLEGVL